MHMRECPRRLRTPSDRRACCWPRYQFRARGPRDGPPLRWACWLADHSPFFSAPTRGGAPNGKREAICRYVQAVLCSPHETSRPCDLPRSGDSLSVAQGRPSIRSVSQLALGRLQRSSRKSRAGRGHTERLAPAGVQEVQAPRFRAHRTPARHSARARRAVRRGDKPTWGPRQLHSAVVATQPICRRRTRARSPQAPQLRRTSDNALNALREEQQETRQECRKRPRFDEAHDLDCVAHGNTRNRSTASPE